MRHIQSIIIFLLIVVAGASSQAQQNSGRVIVWDSDSSRFPDVSFTARVVAPDGLSVTGLNSDSFSVGEVHDGPLNVSTTQDALHTVIIVDTTGNGSTEAQLIRELVRLYGSSVYRSGDTTHLMTIDGGVTTASSVDAFNSFARNLEFSGFRSAAQFRAAFDGAVQRLTPFVNQGRNAQVILISAFLPSGEMVFNNSDIPLHVIQAHENRIGDTSRYRGMATGQFVEVRRTVGSQAQTFFSQIQGNRELYQISYRSRAAGRGERQVPVSVNIGGINAGTLSYSANVSEPLVEIIRSESPNFTFSGAATYAEIENADGSFDLNYGKTTEDVFVRVSFPDGINRPVQQATLHINGQAVETKDIRLGGPGEFDLRLQLDEYLNASKIEVAVSVTDYFNLVGSSAARDIGINYSFPELEALMVDRCAPGGDLHGTAECILKDNATIAYGTMAALAGAVVLSLGVIVWQGRKLARAAAGAIGRVSEFGVSLGTTAVDIGRKTALAIGLPVPGKTQIEEGGGYGSTLMNGQETEVEPGNMRGAQPVVDPYGPPMAQQTHIEQPSRSSNNVTHIENEGGIYSNLQPQGFHVPENAFAALEVLESPIELSHIYMKGTILAIGRQEDFVDEVILHDSISRRHCEISYDHTSRTFTIQDMGSGNGTFINGKSVTGVQPLQNGDKLSLCSRYPFEFRFVINANLLTGRDSTSSVIGPDGGIRARDPGMMTDVVRNFRPSFSDSGDEDASVMPAPVARPTANGDRSSAPVGPIKIDDDDDWLN